jgi:hypothetical protein
MLQLWTLSKNDVVLWSNEISTLFRIDQRVCRRGEARAMVVEMNKHESVGEYEPLLSINDLSMLFATFVVV